MGKAPTRLFLGVEKSACGRAWRDRLDERGSARALAIAQRNNVPELLARILSGRGVEPDAVEAYLDPTVKALLPDPDVLTAMPQAAQRLADAVENGENVAIFGDYDVDGATSSALLARFLRHCGLSPMIHIPDRLFEGYGPNTEAIRALAEKGATLAGHRRLRHHELRAAQRGAQARPRCGGDRPSSMRSAIAGRARRWSIRTGRTIFRISIISPRSVSSLSRSLR